ncbi:MAG: sulfatase-like hydrolase/transferase [Myxococcota bacterium]
MNRLARLGLPILATLLVLSGLAYVNRVDLILSGVRFLSQRRYDVAPNRPIEWQTGGDPENRAAADRPPNIVLILADDLGWNDLTFQGGGVAGGTVPTPHIDSLAAQGASFTNGYAANATCAPSRAALMSGRYGTRFGFEFTPTPDGMMPLATLAAESIDRVSLRERYLFEVEDERPYEEMGMPASEITLAELLATRGYHNVHIGKWHLGRVDGMAPHEQGFDESLLMTSGLYLPEDDPEVVNSKQEFDGIDQFLWASMNFAAQYNGGPAFAPGGYLTDWYSEEAVRVIEANRDRPFFLYLAHWAPHTPLQALREDYEALDHIELHRERVYAAMIRSLDRGIGQVLQALEDQGLADNTLVLFTSDNGGAGYIGLPDVNQPYRGWKMTLFEGGIHVPYFLKWPERIEPGTEVDAPVHHFDLYATAAAAAGATLPTDRKVDGIDLLPWATGDANGVPHEALFWRSGASRSALIDGWKLNVSDPPGRTWLYEMSSDPTEKRDRSEAEPERLASMLAALDAHDADQGPPGWASRMSAPVNLDKDGSLDDAPDDEYIYWSN